MMERIQEAIFAASDGDVIEVPAGHLRGRLVVDRAITLAGAGAGRTLLDGAGRTVIVVEATSGTVRFENLSVVNGRGVFGGGLAVDNGASVECRRCLFEGNGARHGRGGAIAVDGGALVLTECTLFDNHALEGGALFAGGDARVRLSACVISKNFAVRGGAIAAVGGPDVEVHGSRLTDNRADADGHHLYTYGTHRSRPHLLFSNTLLAKVRVVGPVIWNETREKAAVAIDNSAGSRLVVSSRIAG